MNKSDPLFINMRHMYTNSHSQKRPGIEVLIRSDHQKHGQGKKRWTDQHLWRQKEPEMTYLVAASDSDQSTYPIIQLS